VEGQSAPRQSAHGAPAWQPFAAGRPMTPQRRFRPFAEWLANGEVQLVTALVPSALYILQISR
jgi:hypothetical protein